MRGEEQRLFLITLEAARQDPKKPLVLLSTPARLVK